MGGRTFECLDAVINRYRKEQIVEGHTLVQPVCRVSVPPSLTLFVCLFVQATHNIGPADFIFIIYLLSFYSR